MADYTKESADELAKKRDILREINQLRARLKKDKVELLDIGSLETAQTVLENLKEETRVLGEDASGLITSWKDITSNILKSNEGIKLSNKALNNLSDISSQIANVQAGLADMSSREISKLKSKVAIEERNLRISKELLEKQLESLNKTDKEYEKVKRQLDSINRSEKEIEDTINRTNEAISEQARRQKNIEKSMGLTGLALKGAEGLLGKMGLSGLGDMFGEAADKAKEVADRVTEGGNKTAGFTGRLKILGAGFGSLMKSAMGFLNPLNLISMAIGGIVKLFNFAKEKAEEGRSAVIPFGDAITGVSRSLGLAENAVSKMVSGISGAGPSFEATAQSAGEIYSALGSTEKISPKILKDFVQLNIYAGISADSLAKFYKFSKLSGENAGKMVKNISDTALQQIKSLKLSVSMKNLLKDVSEVADTVKIRFVGQEGALVKTVAMSKKLGVEMKKMEDMAKGLLNFEDSIAAEMEAELLTGKQLNLEKARELALQGKSEEAAKLLIEQAGGLQEFQQMNVVQQEAMAKAIGMSRDEMANMLVKQKENVSLQGDLVDGQKDGEKAMKSGMSASEAEAARQRAAQADSMKYYSRLSPLMEKLEKIWNKIKDNVFKLLDKHLFQPLMNWVESPEGKEFFEKTLPAAIDNAFKKIGTVIENVKKFVQEHPTLFKVLAGGIVGFKLAKAFGLDEVGGKLMKGIGEKFGLIQKKRDGSSADAATFVQIAGGGDPISQVTEALTGDNGAIDIISDKTKFKADSKIGKLTNNLTGRFGKFGKFLGKFGGKFSMVTGLLGKFGGSIKGIAGNIGGWFKNAIGKVGGSLLNAGKSLFGGVKSLFSKGASAGGGLLSKAGGFFKNVGGKIVSGVKSGAKFVGNVASKLNPASLLKGGLLSKAAKFIGKAVKGGGLMSVLMAAGELASILTDSSLKPLDKAKKLIPAAAGAIGGVLGSIAGSVLGPLGTFAGGTLGSLAGQYIGESKPIQNALAPPLAKALGGEEVPAADFISRPGMPLQKFRKDDIIIGGTQLLGGGNSKEQQHVIKLLEKLVMLVEKGGDIHIDGSKVGKTISMVSSRIR